MKTLFPILLILALGCKPSEKDSAAVRAVGLQFAEALAVSQKKPRALENPKINFHQCVTKLGSIDASACPDDFKKVWRKFVSAVTEADAAERKGNGKDFQNLFKILAAGAEASAHPWLALKTVQSVDNSPSPEMRDTARRAGESMQPLVTCFKKYLDTKSKK